MSWKNLNPESRQRWLRSPRRRYAIRVVQSARRGGHACTLTYDEYLRVVVGSVCHYCAGDLPDTGSGLDRIDNRLGYAADNVVPCCGRCNVERMALPYEDYQACGLSDERGIAAPSRVRSSRCWPACDRPEAGQRLSRTRSIVRNRMLSHAFRRSIASAANSIDLK